MQMDNNFNENQNRKEVCYSGGDFNPYVRCYIHILVRIPMLSLSVETDKEYYTPSENITITIILRNNGLQERCVARMGIHMPSLFIIFHTPNNETLMYKGPVAMCWPSSMVIGALGEYRYTYTLNNTTKHYWGNFTETGRYEVIALRT